jgi:uncharacterized damage-inducible protein DinB
MDPTRYYRYVANARAELWSFLHRVPEAHLGEPLIPGSRFRTIKHLLLHIADVEDFWVHEVIRGTTPLLSQWPHDRFHPETESHPLAWIHEYSVALQQSTESYLSSINSAELARVVRQPPPQPQTPYSMESVLWHALTHEVRHSAQIVLLARQLGHEPPWLDFGRFM